MERESESQIAENDRADILTVICYVCGSLLLAEDEILKETCVSCQNIVDQGD